MKFIIKSIDFNDRWGVTTYDSDFEYYISFYPENNEALHFGLYASAKTISDEKKLHEELEKEYNTYMDRQNLVEAKKKGLQAARDRYIGKPI